MGIIYYCFVRRGSKDFLTQRATLSVTIEAAVWFTSIDDALEFMDEVCRDMVRAKEKFNREDFELYEFNPNNPTNLVELPR